MRTAPLWVCVLVAWTAACTWPVNRAAVEGRRRFYLTKASFQGNRALTACAPGYHMASRFEILDVSVLDYDTSMGLTTDDSGSGPPSMAASYESPGPSGWVRTGGASQFTDPTGAAGPASTNCATWSSDSPQAYGTVAYLTDRFTSENNSAAAAWNGRPQRCDVAARVWCVESAATRAALPSARGHRGHQRGGGRGAMPAAPGRAGGA